MIDGQRDWYILFNKAMDVELVPTSVDLICFLNTYYWFDVDACT